MIKQRVGSSFPRLYKSWGNQQKISEKDFIDFSKVFPYCICNKYPAKGPNKNTQLIIGVKEDDSDFSYNLYKAVKYEDGYWRIFALRGSDGAYYFILLNACNKEELLPTETSIFRREKSLDATLSTSTPTGHLSSIIYEEEKDRDIAIYKVIPGFENPEEIKDYIINVFQKKLNEKLTTYFA